MKTILTILSMCTALMLCAQTFTWYEVPTGTDKQLNVIEFASPSVGYIGGNDSLLLKTVDGGMTWQPVAYTGVDFAVSQDHIINLKFVSETTGYMTVGPYGSTYKTSDGGNTWTPLTFSGTMCYNQGMYLFSEDNGIFGGAGCFQGEHIEVMNAGVLTPSTINTPSWMATDFVADIDFYDADFGLAVSASRFLRTTDGGATWDTIPSGIIQVPLTSVEIINDTLAYAGYVDGTGGGYGILKTTDSGLTWNQEVEMATFFYPDYHDVGETNDGHVFTVGGTDFQGTGIIFENYGLGWSYSTVDHTLRSVDSYNDSTVFAVGDSGLVITNIDPAQASLTSLTKNNQMIMVYPNPATDVITLDFDDGVSHTNLQVVVWNLAGEKVLNMQDGSQQVDVSGIGSGVYILEVSTEGERYLSRFVKTE